MTPALEAAEVDALRVIFTSLGATVADLDAAMALAGPTAQVQVPDGALPDEALASRGARLVLRASGRTRVDAGGGVRRRRVRGDRLRAGVRGRAVAAPLTA